MKMIKHLFAVFTFVFISIAINSGCDTNISEIVPYSGEWKISFTNSNGTVLSNSILTIQDTGRFCGEITVFGSGNTFFVQGNVTDEGEVTGSFSSSCTGTVSGNISGLFTELMGAGYASGTFNDTTQNPTYVGTWEGRRN